MDDYIKLLIKLSKKAYKNDDVPVSAIIVENGKIIAKSYNMKYKLNDPTAHAEILVIRKACKLKKTNYLNDCEIYISLEPCMMCLSAILQVHIKKVYFLLESNKYGYLIKNSNLINYEYLYNEEYKIILQNFFETKRLNVPRATLTNNE